MTGSLPLLLAILLPLPLRELVHWRCMARDRAGAKGTPRGGNVSNAVWMVVYVTLLGLDAVAVVRGEALPWAWAGAAVLWSGALLRCAAYRALGAHYAMGIVVREHHEVIQRGPYRCLRHPLHLGLLIEITGLALVTAAPFAAALAFAALVALLLRNRGEERVLLEGLGEPYRLYRQRTWDLVDLLPGAR